MHWLFEAEVTFISPPRIPYHTPMQKPGEAYITNYGQKNRFFFSLYEPIRMDVWLAEAKIAEWIPLLQQRWG
jgi:hypothetical protein